MDEIDNLLDNIVEIPIPPGISQSILVRIMELCNVQYEVKNDEIMQKEYPVIFGEKENIEKAKKYFILFTEAKLALRDIGRLIRRFKANKVKLYCEDATLNNVINILLNDIPNGDKIEVSSEKIENEDFEEISICGKPVLVFVY